MRRSWMDYAEARSYEHVAAILKNGIDRLPPATELSPANTNTLPDHENVRGPSYYEEGEASAE